jgi:tetratricopeptide (TPR) repeat protein
LILDPGNLFLVTASAGTLAAARNIKETKQVIDRGLERFPDDPTLHFLRGQLIFGYTGSVDEWRQALDRFGHDVPELALLDQRFNLLRFERRYADIQDLLGTVDTPAIRVLAGQASSGFFGVGKRPTALYRGWLALLLGQPSEAGRHGRAVLEFVSAQKETPWSGWFLRLLEAHGYALTGDRERAIAAARRAVELMPRSRDALGWMAATHSAAAALAWSDAHDEANALLEELSVSVPGPPPALITRDPLFAIPLAQHAGYRALAERLEEQMRGTGL